MRPASMDRPPAGYRLTGRQAEAIADPRPRRSASAPQRGGVYDNVFEKSGSRWQVSYYVMRGKETKEIAQIYVSDDSGRVTEAWTGPQVAWTMARGYPGAFGRKVNSPSCGSRSRCSSSLPFVDPRRLLRIRHLDLAVLMAFGSRVAFFNDANIDVSVPLAYPLLVYLLARMLWIGLRARPPPRPAAPARAGLVAGRSALLFLVGFRIGLNVADSNVIDVGYAGVIGADRLADGDRLYGGFPKDNEHGDTYGPVTYAAYVPFEQVLPWSGRWDDLPAAHAAASPSTCCASACSSSSGGACAARRSASRSPTRGRRTRSRSTRWTATSTTRWSPRSSWRRIAAASLARGPRRASSPRPGMAKFAPLALAPLFATYSSARRAALRRSAARAALVPCLLLVLGYGGLHEFYDRTLGFQASRGSPFSIWGLYGWGTAQTAVQVAAVAARRRRRLPAAPARPRRALPRWRPRCSSRCSSASRTGSTSTSCGSSGRADRAAGRRRARRAARAAVLRRAARAPTRARRRLALRRRPAPGGAPRWHRRDGRRPAGRPRQQQLLDRRRPAAARRRSARSTPMSHGSSSDVSKRTDMCVRSDSIACSLRTPMTPPRGPVIPTSVM